MGKSQSELGAAHGFVLFFGNRTGHHAHRAQFGGGVAVFGDFLAVFVQKLQRSQAVGFIGAVDFPVADSGFVGRRIDEAFFLHFRYGFPVAESRQYTVFLDTVFVDGHFDIAARNRADIVPVAADTAAAGRSRLAGTQKQGSGCGRDAGKMFDVHKFRFLRIIVRPTYYPRRLRVSKSALQSLKTGL